MRRIRIFALGIVSFITALMSALLAPGTIVNRALSAALCSVFSFNSTICTVNLAKSSERVVAATPLAVERNISDWLVQRDPGEFDDAPSVPPFPQDPGPNIIRPEFDDPGSRIDPSLIRPSPPSPDVDRAIDSATENATGEALLLTEKCDFSSVGTSRAEQKCFGAAGNQCEGGLPGFTGKNPRYHYDTCMVEAFVSTGSEAHDNCCVDNPRGFACDGYGNPNHTESPNNSTLDSINSPCEAEFKTATNNVTFNRGRWQTFGPYFRRRQQTAQKPETQNAQQPQQTPQKSSITVTISGPNVIEVNEKSTVEVKFVDPACRATSVTLRGPSLALPSAKKPIPAELACGGTVSFTVGRFGDNKYGCGEYENVFGASVSGEGLQLSAYSPPVTIKHKPGGQDYWSCYAWPID
ncbi:MAG: hypothetical protein WCD53_01285 [Microcoleus sp.]